MFSSYDQMEFQKTSRRDDFVSVAYLLIYLLNKNELPGLDHYVDQFIRSNKEVDTQS